MGAIPGARTAQSIFPALRVGADLPQATSELVAEEVPVAMACNGTSHPEGVADLEEAAA
ncbi:MAG TPA: hypothetical protein VFB20_06290 [Burkholderiales bacterium]|nr:hypothetical protein [Burkholderiales bacterium]